jgi:hypothetical protein
MKNHGFISIAAGCLAALCLSVLGCMNPLDRPSEGSDSATGSVTIALAQEGARTLLPQEPNFSYILSFLPQEGQAAPEPISDITKAQLEAGYSVTLAEGAWKAQLDGMVSVNLGSGAESVKAASGESQTFTITAGQPLSNPVLISFNLEGIGTGSGIFAWELGDLSSDAETAELKIRTLTGEAVDGAADLDLTVPANRSGTKVLPAGYYLVQITVSGAEQSRTRTEVLHIYTGLTSKADMQEEFAVINDPELKERLDALGDGETLILNQNSPLEPYTISGRTVILKSSGPERVIQLAGGGSLFTLEAGGKLILDQGVTLKGSNHSASLVQVNSGAELTMKAGAKISGNRKTSSFGASSSGASSYYYSYGGGVYVASSGTFTMEGGEISGNSASSSSSSSSSGAITSITSSSFGGGVYVASSGTFTMKAGAKISGNSTSASGASSATSYSSGGGVYASTFTMEGGEISGNSASSSGVTSYYSGGGGVCALTFTKTGGTIYGYTEDDPLSNTVKQRGGVVQTGKGHAVYANDTHFRDTTVTADQDMSKSGNDYTGAWTD